MTSQEKKTLGADGEKEGRVSECQSSADEEMGGPLTPSLCSRARRGWRSSTTTEDGKEVVVFEFIGKGLAQRSWLSPAVCLSAELGLQRKFSV